MPKIAHIDYEGRSRCDLKASGAHRYAIDPSTELFMASVSRDGPDEPVYLWINPKFESADRLSDPEAEEILAEAEILYAHNAPFEQAVTWGTHQRGAVSPFAKEPPLSAWRCTAAMARKAGLPFSLEKCAEALGITQQKDTKGKALIRFFCEPKEDGTFNEPRDFPDKWLQFCDYCVQDNRAEKGVHVALKPFELTGAALATFQFDLRMNQRGIPINVPAAQNAQRIIDEVQASVSDEFRKLTGLNPTQRAKVLTLVQSLGCGITDMQAETVEAEISRIAEFEARAIREKASLTDAAQKVIQVLRMYQILSYAAVKKIAAMLACVCPDGRVRGGHLYYGAGTGRWAGRLVQPQNFKKTLKEFREFIDEVYQWICRGVDAEGLQLVYGDPLELISNCIRNFIHGLPLLDGDYAAVEARIICWLAGQDDVLEMYRRGIDLYKWMASHVYDIPIDEVDLDQREVGKRVILGAGFQMGPDKFKATCLDLYQLDLPLDLCERGICMFRERCTKVVDYWKFLKDHAMKAIELAATSGPFSTRRIAGINFLMFKLRSGRSLAYPHPQIDWELVKGEGYTVRDGIPVKNQDYRRKSITYWGQLPGSTQWGRIKLYGGKLAENETQATAGDFMAHGAITAEARGMPPFMLVHDQGLAEQVDGHTPQEYAAALGDLPPWAAGMPLRVDAKLVPFYKK